MIRNCVDDLENKLIQSFFMIQDLLHEFEMVISQSTFFQSCRDIVSQFVSIYQTCHKVLTRNLHCKCKQIYITLKAMLYVAAAEFPDMVRVHEQFFFGTETLAKYLRSHTATKRLKENLSKNLC